MRKIALLVGLLITAIGTPCLAAFNPANIPTIVSISALRALPAQVGAQTSTISVQGFATANDGGGGLYTWSSASTCTDNSATCVEPASAPATGRWTASPYNLTLARFGVLDQTGDQTTDFQAALNFQNPATSGPFSIFGYDYKNAITVSNLTQPLDTSLVGQAVDGLFIAGKTGSTGTLYNIPAAQKVSLQNVTFSCNSVSGYTIGVNLGSTTQAGTNGKLDQVTVRNCPNGTAMALDGNIIFNGRLYFETVNNGLLDTGNGNSFAAVSVAGYTGTAVTCALSDNFGVYEAEGGGATSIAFDAERSCGIGNFIYSPSLNVNQLHPFIINTNNVQGLTVASAQFYSLCAGVVSSSCATFGVNTTSAQYHGTATAGGGKTLTDSGASFPITSTTGMLCPSGCLAGGGIWITSGTGSGQWYLIASNTATVITIDASAWSTQPDNTSTYAVNQFVQYSTDGGVTITGGAPFSETGFSYNNY